MNKSDSIGIRFDNMVRFPKDDELGLFEKYDEILEETRNRIRKFNGKCILDIGCGTGNLCGELNGSYNIIGIDKNLEMLERAKEKYKHITFREGNFLEPPFKEKYFDIVVSTFVFHALCKEEKKKVIQNMMTYIKDNGKIIIVDYMFLNTPEKEKYKEKFKSEKREELWDFINSKHYASVQELNEYVPKLNYIIKAEHIINFTWIVEITKND